VLGAVQDSLSRSTPIFSSTFRLLRVDGFDHVIKSENIADKYLKIFFVKNCYKNARIGIVASKRILPRAVDRNRVKRIIRERFRLHDIKFCKLDVVVIVKRDFLPINGKNADNLEKLFSEIKDRCAE
jgi:ribonuclease P protein component